MPTTLTSKGQVTIPKRIREALCLLPGAAVGFSVNAAGEVVLHPPKAAHGARAPVRDRFDTVRGRADVRWRTVSTLEALDGVVLTMAQVLPDFFMGAHAAVQGRPLLTRDASRFRTCFPKLEVLAP